MKISILTEGFKDIGYGHITRCLSLSQAFEEKHIHPALYINGDENCKSFLNSRYNYKIVDWLNHPAQILNDINNSDILIIDSYITGREFYKKISKHSQFSLFVDDNLRIDYPSGIILNGTIGAETFPYKSNNDFLIGTKYVPLRKEFWNQQPRKINQKVSSVLLTFGGQDNKNITPVVLTSIQERFPHFNINVVVGSGFTNTAEIEKQKKNNTKLYFSPNAHQMFGLMYESDIAISAAGQTLYELAVTGTPTVAIAVVENQKQNIIEWKKKGFVHNTIYHSDINYIKKVLDQVESLQSVTQRKKLSRIGKANVDGQGSKRVVDYLIETYCNKNNYYFRNTVESDSNIVYELSNDPSVRSQSINQEMIPWKVHQEWFFKKIKDDNYIFLLAFDKKDNMISQVRFQIDNEIAAVSISIKNEFRGKGLSQNLLNNACARVFSLKRSVKRIIAYILPDNYPSINGFKSAGFILSGEEIINDRKFLKFLLEKE